jgi:transcription-repair coupling factor (superfamily II helicase)
MKLSAGMKFEYLPLRMDEILERELQLGRGTSNSSTQTTLGDPVKNRLRWVGTSSLSALALYLSQSSSKEINRLPHLVVVSGSSEAYKFEQAIQFFDSSRKVVIGPHFDVSPYLGLPPKPQAVAQRLRFLFAAQSAKPGDIFVAPIGSLQQLAIPFQVLNSKSTKIDDHFLFPTEPSEWLNSLGYVAAPVVEDVGQYAVRGGIIDIFSPAHDFPCRFELFGDQVESLRSFSSLDQRSLDPLKEYSIIPCKETLYDDSHLEKLVAQFREDAADRAVDRADYEEMLRSLTRQQFFPGIDFLLPYFYKSLENMVEHFSSPLNIWQFDPMDLSRQSDHLLEEIRTDYNTSTRQVIHPDWSRLYVSAEKIPWPGDSRLFQVATIDAEELSSEGSGSYRKIPYSSYNLTDLTHALSAQAPGSLPWLSALKARLQAWRSDGQRVLIAVKSKSQIERLKLLFEKIDLRIDVVNENDQQWMSWLSAQEQDESLITLVPRMFPESFRLPEERIVILREEDLLGKKSGRKSVSSSEEFQKKARRLSFGDLKPGDTVVHVLHGIGVYEGLKLMPIGGIENEFIQIAYKDKDKLYLPVYRVGQLQKYSGAAAAVPLDKLGGPGWEKTKAKVKGHLRDIANELLQLYAKRAELHRPAFVADEKDISAFEASFPYAETDDQQRAINDLYKDMVSTQPMDRLICGDVGFGKTEVAMRAAFLAAHNRKQVAVLAPTTVLTFQHFETFKKRFAAWPLEIRCLNRFVSNAEAKKTLNELKLGKVDILIGTHRLLSKDVEFKDLGLLIIDEEQKFGVAHKEKIKKLKTSVDTLAMSATPIPRTLNMSLMGVRDLSLINTAPVDRLPTRTFISKFDEDLIRKAITSEISRGGQVYFIHNRVQSIYGLVDELRQIVPEARVQVAHGQMEEHDLEKAMLQFFHHEIDVLVCTAIVESGMDVSAANTMFIDQPQLMGLSQLYQLRGRVGRSKQRAYCYLILPRDKKLDKDAQERLKVIQENTALGSGISIAQYDLEMRGSGNILGEEQSGHANSVGHELYMDLLNEAVSELKGNPIESAALDPEINLRIPAMIPDKYIPDIRIRLSYYKALADIRNEVDLEQIEGELKDQFGEIPDATLNLMGLMLIRAQCKELGVRDVSAGAKNVSLVFTERTKLKPETVISLAVRENKKYAITPDHRLNIRMNNITWPAVHEELSYLLKLV